MKFKIYREDLLKAYKITSGFTSKRKTRPILEMVHIVCNAEENTVMFESTDAMKIVRWSADVEALEKGECSFKFSQALVYLLKQTKKGIPFQVTIYEENDTLKADVDGNIIKLEKATVDFPQTNSVFENRPETYDNEPIIDIGQLEEALKSMRLAGATDVRFYIPTVEFKTIKMVAKTFVGAPIISVIATKRDF